MTDSTGSLASAQTTIPGEISVDEPEDRYASELAAHDATYDDALTQRWPDRVRRLLQRTGTRALLAYALLALAADLPIFPGDPWRLPALAGEDIIQTTWFLEWTPWAILHGHNVFQTTLLDAPKTVDLAQNTGIPLLGLLTAPLTLAVSPVASLNLLRWVAFWLSAYAAFAVIRRWTTWAPAAFVGGLLYGFSPYMVAQGSVHLNLTFVPLPPVIFYLLGELIVFQRKPPLRTGLCLGFACVAQFYISSEILATTALVAGIAIFFIFFLCVRQVPTHYRHALIGLASAAALLGPLIAYPVFLMFHGTGHYAGPAQGYNNVYNADLLGPFIPSTNQLFAPTHLRAIGSGLVGNNPQENGSYLGLPLLVLFVVMVLRYWRRMWVLFLALLVITIFSLTLGPVLIVNGHVHTLPFDLPFRKIDHLPGINNVLPVRLSLYMLFFLSVLIALGIESYRRDVLERRARRGDARLLSSVLVGRLAGGALVIASAVALVPNWPYKSFPLELNRAEEASSLAIIPTGSTVLTYPYATAFADNAMLWQALDSMRFRILGSYALVAGSNGLSSVFPATLQPSIVEAMLVNSITPTPDPDLAPVVATQTTIDATDVVVKAGATRPKAPHAGQVVGRVTEVDSRTNNFIVDVSSTRPVSVVVSGSTHYSAAGTPVPSFAAIAPGKWVVLSGKAAMGTVTPTLVRQLRQFLANNHVDAIVDDLGLRDSWEIGLWIRAAIGKPTRAGEGGLIWIDVQQRLKGAVR